MSGPAEPERNRPTRPLHQRGKPGASPRHIVIDFRCLFAINPLYQEGIKFLRVPLWELSPPASPSSPSCDIMQTSPARCVSTLLLVAATLTGSIVSGATESIVNSLGMKLVPIAAGGFVMGSDQNPANWDEQPRHRVTITTPFLIAETEVTADQFRQFKPDAPLNENFAPYAAGVSWREAVAFCAWLGQKEGRTYRLPTEAEWEYVCRAGRADGVVWETKPEAANPWGLRNLLADPVEWCGDWYGEYDFAAERDPAGYAAGAVKIVRGGFLNASVPEISDKDYPAAAYRRPSNRAGAPPSFGPYADGRPNPGRFGLHKIGFRVVLAPDLKTAPKVAEPTLVLAGVKSATADVRHGPDATRPYLRRRPMLPIPPEDTKQAEINHAGLHPSFRGHNHSPGFEILPNGDALLVIYTSYHEYEPEVSLIAARLRFGADQWDMPSPLLDTPGGNDASPLLWHDGAGTLWLFWGNPLVEGRYPFQYVTSRDGGATWSEVNYPHITGPLGIDIDPKPQPINTVIRDQHGTLYLAVDAAGGGPLGAQSMLWATADDGATWHDTLGRTGGRHTSFVLRKDGSILGLGGKNSAIDGFMPRAISQDGGRTYAFGKTPFAPLNSGQRPCIIRLASGRLFMAGDYQPSKTLVRSASITEHGSYVALSDDDGETWRIKRLPGTYVPHRKRASVGYCVARQAPNGVIHLITSLNKPARHYELNEAWILSDVVVADDDPAMDRSRAGSIHDVTAHRENFPDGQPRLTWSSGRADDGRELLQGKETWYYAGGAKQHETDYQLGLKTGIETYWSPTGAKRWEWHHHADGTSDWITYWSDGAKRSESMWKNHALIPGTDKFYEHALLR